MLEIIRDPLWQFVGALIAIITLIFTVFVYLQQKNLKSIAYGIISDTKIVSVEEDVKDRLQVLFDNKLVNDARLVVLKIFNSGNVPITPPDFIRPITIDFEEAKILDVEVLETEPKNLKDSLKIGLRLPERVVINRFLLNKKSSVTLKVLLTLPFEYAENYIKVNALITGVDQIDNVPLIEYPRSRLFYPTLSLIFLLVVALIGGVIFAILRSVK